MWSELGNISMISWFGRVLVVCRCTTICLCLSSLDGLAKRVPSQPRVHTQGHYHWDMGDESMRRNGPITPSEPDDQADILHPLMDENRSDPILSATWLLVILVLGATGFGLGTVEATLATKWNLLFLFGGKVVLENISSKRCVDCCATLRSQPCACAFNQVAFMCTSHTWAAFIPRKCNK